MPQAGARLIYIPPDNEDGIEGGEVPIFALLPAAETFGKEGNPFAASALTQACLNALAFFSPAGKALSVPPTEMRKTHPLVAEILSRVSFNIRSKTLKD